MGEKKNEKKDKKKKWPSAHEVLTVLLLDDVTCIQTISKAYATGMAAPSEGIPGLINALELAKLTTLGKTGFIAKDINTSIRNLKKQLTEAKVKEQKSESTVSTVMEMCKEGAHRTHRTSKI